jgi:hypothetical protein
MRELKFIGNVPNTNTVDKIVKTGIIDRLIIWYLSIQYKKYGKDNIYFIRGTDNDYPKLLYYTENEKTRNDLETWSTIKQYSIH